MKRRSQAVLVVTALAVAACSPDPVADRVPTTSGSAAPATSAPGSTPADPTPADPTPADPTTQNGRRLSDWDECPEEAFGELPATARPEGVDCATLTVPLDYSKPNGTTISVALARSKATGGGDRIGSLLLNPGGPGEGGRSFLTGILMQKADQLGPLQERFDLIGFDPRGVEGSNGIECIAPKLLDQLGQVDITPETAAERRRGGRPVQTGRHRVFRQSLVRTPCST